MSGEDDTLEPTVKITLRTIYNKLLDVEAVVAPLPEKVGDHETRIRLLEVFKAKREGVSAIASGCAYITGGAIVGFVLNHVVK